MRQFMGETLQVPIRRKDLQLAPLTSLPKTFRFKGTVTGAEIDMKKALGIILRPNADLQAYYDTDTSKVWTIEGSMETTIIPDTAAETITITGSATNIEVGGF